ncbi:MAG: WecB/TagA/CpsF family glycosyltransferase, partial [Clostridia bacterium]|nr:WecB/TagA/CpsF family glycosyltransferase [Clostridia bacterium]
MDRVNILGVNVDMVTISEATDKILDFLDEDKLHSVYTPNSEIIMEAYRNQDFNEILNAADLLTADGIGVVYAAKYLKKPIKERAAGYDVAKLLLQKISYTDHKLFLFGGKPGVGDLAKKNMQKDYPGLNIVGVRNGYFTDDEEEEIINEINASGADLLFVCLGAPRQEKWIHKNKDKLKVKVAMGVGGSI